MKDKELLKLAKKFGDNYTYNKIVVALKKLIAEEIKERDRIHSINLECAREAKAQEVFDDKEFDVVRDTNKFRLIKKRHLSTLEKAKEMNISSKKDCPKCHKNSLLSEQEIKENVCCYCRSSPS